MDTPITNVLKEYLEVNYVAYRMIREWHINAFFECSHATFPVEVIVDKWEKSMIVFSIAPIQPVIERCDEISELLYHLNVHQNKGVFHLSDLEAGGEITFQTRCSFKAVEPTQESFDISIRANLAVMSLYLPVFALVMFADMSAEEAFALAPDPDSGAPPYWFLDMVECRARCECIDESHPQNGDTGDE